MSGWTVLFAWLGLLVGLWILVSVERLLYRVLRPVNEIERYTRDILDAGLGIARNLDGADEAVRTRELALEVPRRARLFLGRLVGA